MNIHLPEFFRGRLAMVSLRVAQIVTAIACIVGPIVGLIQTVKIADVTGPHWVTFLALLGVVVDFFVTFALLVVISVTIAILQDMSLKEAMGNLDSLTGDDGDRTDFIVRCANGHAVPVRSASAGCTISCPVCRIDVKIPPLSRLRGGS